MAGSSEHVGYAGSSMAMCREVSNECRPHWHHVAHVAPCGVLLPPLDKHAIGARGQTRANVAYSLASPPVIGTSGRFGQGEVYGRRDQYKHTYYFCAGFFLLP